MAAPALTIAANDGKVYGSNTGTVLTVSFEPQNTNAAANGAAAPNRAAATETLPAKITLGQAKNSAAAVNGQYNTDAVLTLPGERPSPQQE